MGTRPIHTEFDYKQALAEVSRLVDLDPKISTPNEDRLEVLAKLIETYEATHCRSMLP